MEVWLAGIYGGFALVAGLNWGLMRRAVEAGEADLVILIPARNEEANLRRLLPSLAGARVVVFDDESSDATGEVARALGAQVVTPDSPLPKGWTGKNRACHELATSAPEVDWLVFLDADVYPADDFVPRLRGLLQATDPRVGVVTGFPKVLPGRGVEPLFLTWVGWMLLATNPFGLVARTGKGHNMFTNGQFHAWRREVYLRERPNEAVRGRILEDVAMGRLMARRGVPVEVVNVSEVLGVKMYEEWHETVRGLSKNSFEIFPGYWGSVAFALLMLAIGWGWMLWPPAVVPFLLSGWAIARTAKVPLWPVLLLPIALTLGSITVLNAIHWRAMGKVEWKGRTYG